MGADISRLGGEIYTALQPLWGLISPGSGGESAPIEAGEQYISTPEPGDISTHRGWRAVSHHGRASCTQATSYKLRKKRDLWFCLRRGTLFFQLFKEPSIIAVTWESSRMKNRSARGRWNHKAAFGTAL